VPITLMSEGMTIESRNRAVVLHSGGLDSTVLLTSLLRDGYDCYPLGISYGQRHGRELQSAYEVCVQLGIEKKFRLLNLSALHELVHSRAAGVPNGYQGHSVLPETISPNRNMIFISIAAGYAMTIGASFVAFASHAFTRETYPDCTPEFTSSVDSTVRVASGGRVRVLTPLENMSKARVVRLGLSIDSPLAFTRSCFKDSERPCLQCKACLERTDAFHLNNVPDPALTPEEWKQALQYLEQYAK